MIIIFIIILCALALLLDFYSFFNMTHDGLKQALKVFIYALLLDLIIVRVLITFVLGAIQTVLERFEGNSRMFKQEIDPYEIEALSEIYEIYKENFYQYQPIRASDRNANDISEDCDSQDSLLNKEEN